MEFPPKRSHCLHVSLASLNNDDAHGSTDHNQEPDVLEQWQETVAEDAEDDAEPADAEVCHVDVPLLDDIFRVEDFCIWHSSRHHLILSNRLFVSRRAENT